MGACIKGNSQLKSKYVFYIQARKILSWEKKVDYLFLTWNFFFKLYQCGVLMVFYTIVLVFFFRLTITEMISLSHALTCMYKRLKSCVKFKATFIQTLFVHEKTSSLFSKVWVVMQMQRYTRLSNQRNMLHSKMLVVSMETNCSYYT